MSTFLPPPAIKPQFTSMSTDTTDQDYQEIASSSSKNTAPGFSVDDLLTGSHTFRFDRYSRREGFEVGKYLVSDTFTAGGYEWAIALYPSGKKDQYIDYVSLYIRLESEETDVNAVFELMLVDQSGNGKHKIQTQFGRLQEKQPFLMRRRGSQWGFGQYIKKKHLKKLGYLKDDCLVVNCVVGVLASCTDKEIEQAPVSCISDMDQAVMMESCEDTKFLDLESAARVIIEFGAPAQLQGLVNDADRAKFDHYLNAVDEIQQSIKTGQVSDYEAHGTRAMKTLQLVFQGILDCSTSVNQSDTLSSTLDSSSMTSSYGYEQQGGHHASHHELSQEQVYRLCSIVQRLNKGGCLGDCIEVYRISRKSVVDARFLRFSIGRWSVNDLQGLDVEEFAAKIKLWIQVAQKCYHSIFPGERQYYEQIFDGVRAVSYDTCFLAIVEHVAVELNNFADAVSFITSFRKLFAVLDLYKALDVILPEIQKMFYTVASENICQGASNTITSLATLVRKLFSSFEDTVLNEQSNSPPPDGTIHSLTEYAMNYVTRLSQYKESVTDIITSRPTKSLGNQADEQFLEASDRTSSNLHMIWIMMSLKINLMSKSKVYEDSALRYLFIMNNVTYIIKTVKGSPELVEMIGKEYLSKLRKEVLQAAQDYYSSIWHRVLYCLRDDGLSNKFPFYNGISKNSLKDRFKTFNSTFEEVCQMQSTRLVLDVGLREELQKLILSKLLPVYKAFLEKYGSRVQSERGKERYIKYSSEDLEDKVKKLFSEH
ncbi:exocyst complex component EXO70A1 [Daucus carota subsp. sativus]|nr:PREDICTED: exocyst complex component EXO70A1-like [Daucus carota subsp. sativus]